MGRLHWRASGREEAGEFLVEAAGYRSRIPAPIREAPVRRVELLRIPLRPWRFEGADVDADYSPDAAVWGAVSELVEIVFRSADELEGLGLGAERLVRLLADAAELLQDGPFPESFGGTSDQAAPPRLESDSQGS